MKSSDSFHSLRSKGLSWFLAKIVIVLGIALLGLLLFLCLTTRSVVVQDGSERSQLLRQPLRFYLLLPISLAMLYFCRFFLQKISSTTLLKICTAAYLIAGLYLIFNVSPNNRADSQAVFESALQFQGGDFSSVAHGYMAHYPHQLGLATYDRLLFLFSPNPLFTFFVNLLGVICINYHLYLLSDLVFEGNDLVNKYTILLSYLFLPQLFFILFAYGTIPGFVCLVICIYHAACCLKGKKQKHILSLCLCLLFASLSILIRNNYMIGILALICVFGLSFLDKPNWKKAAFIVLLALTLVVPQKLLYAFYEAESGLEVSRGRPKSLWVAMGLQESPRCSGWFNGYSSEVFVQMNGDYDASDAVAKAEIRSRLNTFAQDPHYAATFFSNKIRSTWCDATFQSIWSGPSLYEQEQSVYTKPLALIYYGDTLYNLIFDFCDLLLVDLLLFALIYMIRCHKDENIFALFPIIFLIGSFLFHLFWETKSQYVYMFIFMLIPLSAKAISGAPVFGFPFKHTKTAE